MLSNLVCGLSAEWLYIKEEKHMQLVFSPLSDQTVKLVMSPLGYSYVTQETIIYCSAN